MRTESLPSPRAKRVLLAVAVLAALALTVSIAVSSSHREAPNIMLDPAADNTDVYAWTADDAPNAITIASDWIPGQVPANGPNFFRFDDRARYYINIDNNGDGVADLRYRYEFDTNVRNPNSFLYAGPGTRSYDQLNVYQTYDLTREEYNSKGRLTDRTKIANDFPVAPSNVGPKTFPNYVDDFVTPAIKQLSNGTKLFVGQRAEPFFVDLGAAFDAINVRLGTGNEGAGKDDFSGYNTSSTVLQIPERLVTRDGQPVDSASDPNAVVGVWSTTERPAVQVNFATVSKRKHHRHHGHKRYHGGGLGPWVQVSRLGNPLINEVVIPLGRKDQFNRTTPDEDAKRYGQFVLNPELARVLNALFGIGAPETNRTDIVRALLQGLPGLNEHSGKFAGTPVDTLKLNLGVPPSSNPSRFGVIGGDGAGFPNGRRPIDDVVDIELQVIAGFLEGNKVALGDGVDQDDKGFLSQFPYLNTPDSGFESNPSQRFEPTHPPVPAGGS
jgi:Domain of unknown function (DUF4331)